MSNQTVEMKKTKRNQQEVAAAELPLGKIFAALEKGLSLPEELSGTEGRNRSVIGVCQIEANDDLQAIQAWLAEYAEQKQTLRAYKKEAERLLLWCWLEIGKPLSSLTRQDFNLYQKFLANPQPAERWIGQQRVPRHSPQWRPFQQGLNPASQQHSLRVLKGLFNYLHQAGYLAGNPLALIKTSNLRKDAQQVRQRHLDQETWQALVDYTHGLTDKLARVDQDEELSAKDLTQLREIERWRLLLAFLYLLAPRVSEVAQTQVKDFFYQRGHWWWAVEGKGQKYAELPVNPALIEAIQRYRKFMQLEPLTPRLASTDTSPLVLNLAGTDGISANMIYRTIKKLTNQASGALAETQPEVAACLAKASTHWFRHTSITHQADAGIDLRFLARNARHANLATTRIYLHEEDVLWQEQNAKHQWKAPW